MTELTLEECRKIYSSSDSLKDLMLSKFKKAELENNEVSQDEFDKKFLELLGKCTKTVFLTDDGDISKLPTNRIELRNANDVWLVDIQFTGRYPHFLVNGYNVWRIFADEYSLQDVDIQRLMKNQMKTRFELDDVTPRRSQSDGPVV